MWNSAMVSLSKNVYGMQIRESFVITGNDADEKLAALGERIQLEDSKCVVLVNWLDSNPNSDFVKKLKELKDKFPNIVLVIVTGWVLDQGEKLLAAGVDVVFKSSASANKVAAKIVSLVGEEGG